MFRVPRKLLLSMTLAVGILFWETANALQWASKAPGEAWFIPLWSLTDGLVGLMLCLVLFRTFAHIHGRFGKGLLVTSALALCVAGGIAWAFLTGSITGSILAMQHHWPWRAIAFSWGAKYLFQDGALFKGTVLVLFSWLFFAFEQARLLDLQREKTQEARLQMLRYQLNPHFLFNTLNSIRALILDDRERARQMVTELSDFLRYSLDSKDQEVSLEEELRAIENYLTIQRIRFEDQLVVRTDVDPAALGISVPCFLIHPLVENAVKHGMNTSALPLEVHIEIKREDPELLIRVSNTGHLVGSPSKAKPPGTGTGLRNIAQRLDLAYPGNHTFALKESEGKVLAEIRLKPWKEEP